MKTIPHLFTLPSAAVTKLHGSPLTGSGADIAINAPSIARTFAWVEGICWDESSRRFRSYVPGRGFFAEASTYDLTARLTEFIATEAKKQKSDPANLKLTNGKLKSILALIKGESLMQHRDHAGLFPVANGVLQFGDRGVKLLPHSRDFWFTSGCDVPYDPEAKCLKFIRMIERTFPDATDRRLLQMYLGAPFTGLNKTRRMLWLHGPTGTSKTTIVNIQERLLGLALVGDLRTGLLTSRFETSHLVGKRLLSVKDAPANTFSVAGAKKLKALVGADHTEAEMKFGGKVSLHGSFFIEIVSNGDLHLALEGDDGAWMDRFLVLEASGGKPDKVIANFADVLLAKEPSGILNVMVEGGVQYLAQVSTHGDFALTTEQRKRVENLVLSSKSLEEFLKGRVQVAEDRQTTTDELIQAYVAFCKGRGWKPMSSHQLYAHLPDLMLQIHGAPKANGIIRGAQKSKGFGDVLLIPA